MVDIRTLTLQLAMAVVCAQPAAQASPRWRVDAADPSVGAATLAAVRDMVGDSLAELAPVFAGGASAHFTVHVHRSEATLDAAVRRGLHPDTSGLALLSRRQVHLILDRVAVHPPRDLRTVVKHELVHILLHHHVGAAGPHVPRWVHEGLAQELSGATYLGVSEEDIVLQARTGNLLLFTDLVDDFPRSRRGIRTAYAQSFSFISYLRREVGLDGLLRSAAACAGDVDFRRAFAAETGEVLIYLERDWVEYVGQGSGAALRLLLGSCFALGIVAALPLLALAGARRWNRDKAVADRLERQDRLEPEPPAGDRSGPDQQQ